MKAITFEGANKLLVAPECFDLPVHNDGQTTTSAWQLEPEDLENLKLNGGVIFLQVVAGQSQPPVLLRTDLKI